jgi:hypothetical protein
MATAASTKMHGQGQAEQEAEQSFEVASRQDWASEQAQSPVELVEKEFLGQQSSFEKQASFDVPSPRQIHRGSPGSESANARSSVRVGFRGAMTKLYPGEVTRVN